MRGGRLEAVSMRNEIVGTDDPTSPFGLTVAVGLIGGGKEGGGSLVSRERRWVAWMGVNYFILLINLFNTVRETMVSIAYAMCLSGILLKDTAGMPRLFPTLGSRRCHDFERTMLQYMCTSASGDNNRRAFN